MNKRTVAMAIPDSVIQEVVESNEFSHGTLGIFGVVSEVRARTGADFRTAHLAVRDYCLINRPELWQSRAAGVIYVVCTMFVLASALLGMWTAHWALAAAGFCVQFVLIVFAVWYRGLRSRNQRNR